MDWSNAMEPIDKITKAMILAGCILSPVYANHTTKIDPLTSTVRYLDTSIWNIVVHDTDCFKASPRSILQVEPITSNEGERVYKISQYFDPQQAKTLYQQPINEQIN